MVSREDTHGARRPPAAVMRVANRLVRPLLNSRAHALASHRLMLLEYTGRRTGRRRTIPIAYAERDPHTVVSASLGTGWPTQLAGAGAVRLRLRGRWRTATPTVVDGRDEIAAEFERLVEERGPAAVSPLRLGLPTDRPAGREELHRVAERIRLVRFRLCD
jgi:deazaflavin-dependent oxidoreductase (nitroreductase family)